METVNCDCGWEGRVDVELLESWTYQKQGEDLVSFVCPECKKSVEQTIYSDAGDEDYREDR